MQRKGKVEVVRGLQSRTLGWKVRRERLLYTVCQGKERDGKDVHQVRVVEDRDGSVLTGASRVMGRWKEYFEELMNEENEKGRVEKVTVVDSEVEKVRMK